MTIPRQLIYKAWLESRTRFLVGGLTIAGLCVAVLLFRDLAPGLVQPANSFAEYVYLRVYGGFVRGIFLFLALVLGLGGLNVERAHHIASFTLSLPVSRAQMEGARALTGLTELGVLAMLPAILVPTLSALAGESYDWSDSLRFLVLWVAVGWSVFAAAFLASCLFIGEYTALTAAVLAFFLYPLVVARTPILRNYPLHIHYIMNGTGMPYFSRVSYEFVGEMPWVILASVLLAATALIALSMLLTKRADFS